MLENFQAPYWSCATSSLPNVLAEANRKFKDDAILFAGQSWGDATILVLTVQAASQEAADELFRTHMGTMESVPAVVPLYELS